MQRPALLAQFDICDPFTIKSDLNHTREIAYYKKKQDTTQYHACSVFSVDPGHHWAQVSHKVVDMIVQYRNMVILQARPRGSAGARWNITDWFL